MPPNRTLAIERYRRFARTYDREHARNPGIEKNHRRVVALLRLRPGDTVLDVGCGTGLNFPIIEATIGQDGRIVGIDQSAEMLSKARERIEDAGWRNATLIEAPVEEAAVPYQADAMLFSFTHDILQTPAALENVFRHAKPGARIASVGYKWAPWWALPWNYVIRSMTRYAITTRQGFAHPWRALEGYAPGLQVETTFLGAVYFAWGTTAGG